MRAALAALATAGLLQAASAAQADADVELLRFPYPYRAAITICNDADRGTIENFEAVHTLVGTTDPIPEGSPIWNRLFVDPAVVEFADAAGGLRGFGLPLADSVFLYHTGIGLYARFDPVSGQPVPQHHSDGRDHRDIFDEWLKRGWLDTLHTAGTGPLPREAVEAGLAWFREAPHRRLRVWTNHARRHTPSSIQADGPDGLLVFKNVAKALLGGLETASGGRITFWRPMRTYPFPPSQRLELWGLSLLVFGSGLWLAACLGVRRWRSPRRLVAGGGVLAFAFAGLQLLPLRYVQGDNPDSPYYNLDLVRDAGFRYFWPIEDDTGAPPGRLAVPQQQWNGRRSLLRLEHVDDGSRLWMFPRASNGWAGFESLEMLTGEGLAALVAASGASILYTHWMAEPGRVFTAKGLAGLTRLRDEYRAGRIWVAPTSQLLHFDFVRAFLRYEAEVTGGRVRLALGQVAAPTGESFTPTLADLAGLSFRLPAGAQVEVSLAGERLSPAAFELLEAAGGSVLRFRAP